MLLGEEPVVISMGDINNDGLTDADDASSILAAYSMISTGQAPDLTEEQLKAADINADGLVNADDASIILSYYSYVSTGGSDSLDTFLNKNNN